ncbi:V-type proton ATPase subunit E [Aplysia californica]|uniref:V-type proton ATPase subunit E n=1 Tax=Aplysia californica TaxID=6500 RepID=A0ABM0K7D2_APLCA|nr:V-type proton ATPase subunit E [Aplysia californica]
MAGMSDAEVQGQIAHMIAFIDQEASEKVEEIDAKAEEEFNLEKGRLVQQARAKIMEIFEKREKSIDLQVKIQNSNLKNAARLKLLKKKEELMSEFFDKNVEEAKRAVRNDPAKYKDVMIKLTVQALVRLLEPKVTVRVRQQDVSLMKSVAQECESQFKNLTKGKYEVKIIVDEENFLSADLIGGVLLFALNDKISVTNTLDDRVTRIFHERMPGIRESLFGSNPNRKFRD